MDELNDAGKKIEKLIGLLKTSGGLQIDARIELPLPVQTVSPDPQSSSTHRTVTIEILGEDAPIFMHDGGELLDAFVHLVGESLRLPPEDSGLLKVHVDRLRPVRREELQRLAAEAVAVVRRTSKPFTFGPMTSAERRILHLALDGSGLHAASTGLGLKRSVVLYPEGVTPLPDAPKPPIGLTSHRPATKPI